MKDNKGLTTILFGTTIAAAGFAVKPVARIVSWGIAGFGLAFVLLGAMSNDDKQTYKKKFCR